MTDEQVSFGNHRRNVVHLLPELTHLQNVIVIGYRTLRESWEFGVNRVIPLYIHNRWSFLAGGHPRFVMETVRPVIVPSFIATRTEVMIEKQVVIRGDVHARIKRLCFDNEVQMKDSINLILSSLLEDLEKLQEIIAELQAEMN
jgi:hypothetical protein